MSPSELPMVGPRPERGDAARNRARILAAARTLLAERSPDAVSLDAIAAAAGVGKGTIFRRFGDRAGLMDALLDDEMRAFQSAFLTGPAPLGPGAHPAERLEAFVLALVRMHRRNLPLALAGEQPRGETLRGVGTSFLLHLRALLLELGSPAPEAIAQLLLGAVSPNVLASLAALDAEELELAVHELLAGVTTARH